VLGTVGKPSARKGARALFCDVLTYTMKLWNVEVFMSNKIRKLILLLIVAMTQGTLICLIILFV